MVFFNRRLWPSQEHGENWFLNFDLKLCTEIGLEGIRVLWKFQIFWFASMPKYEHWIFSCKRHAFITVVSYDNDNEKIWNLHNTLIPLSPISVQSFKSKFKNQFSSCFWRGPQPSIKNTVKTQSLLSNKLLTRTLFRVFISRSNHTVPIRTASFDLGIQDFIPI